MLFVLGLVAGCGKSPTAPTATLSTETFTGVLTRLGVSFHTFNVNYGASYSDAAVRVTRLTTAADGTEVKITVGVGFGTVSVGACTLASALTNPTAAYDTDLPTNGAPFVAGTYCVGIFDNTAAPTVTEPLNYTLTVEHF